MLPTDNKTRAQALSTYSQLLDKVELKFDEIFSRHTQQMKCGQGCHSCCVPDLTVFQIEKENIKAFINQTDGLEQKLKDLEISNPHAATRCCFLDSLGKCSIYAARPLVCRSHGSPFFFKIENESRTDVCPLNFSEFKSLTELESRDFMNLDLLNTLLASINKDLDPMGARTKLKVDEILS